jgi:hypothetical protein
MMGAMPPTLPLVILGGSDRRAATLPAAAAGKHPLTGYKGVDVRLGGRPLVAEVTDRFLAGGFGPVYVAGPEPVYGGLSLAATVIPTDGSLGRNVSAALTRMRAAHPGERVAFTTCDILPDPADLRLVAEHLRADPPVDVWFPLVPVGGREALGASDWKPSYGVVVGPGRRKVRILPGHLVVVRPEAIRQAFFDRVLDEGYGTRNRSVLVRRARMVRRLLGALVVADLRSLLAGAPPSLSFTLVRVLVWGARGLAEGTLTQEQIEKLADPLFVDPVHRRAHPGGGFRLPILEAPTLALDIDTEEEARERGVEVGPRRA